MEFEIAKTFMRGGTLLRPGDDLPEGLDKITLDHYKRHGMVREVKPQEAKPEASKRRSTTARPKETKPAGPGEDQAGSSVHTSAQDAVDPDSEASQDLPVGSEDVPEANN